MKTFATIIFAAMLVVAGGIIVQNSTAKEKSAMGDMTQNIETARQALEQAREHWRVTDSLYRQQMTTSTEVLDARTYLNRAENAYNESRYSHGTAMAQLQWAMGGTIDGKK